MNFDLLQLDSELYDENSPKIIATSFGEISSTDDKVMRFSIRFSEPVHLPTDTDKSGLIITGYANNNTLMPLEFVYAGGEGSDTLYFECNLENYQNQAGYANKKIETVKFRSYEESGITFSKSCENIADYAYNFKLNNNTADLSTFAGAEYTVNVDLRKPSVSSKVVGSETEVAQSHTVNLTTSNMDKTGKLYYTWVKEEDVAGNADTYVPTTYDSCETLSPTAFTVTGELMDGNYYLYYKAVSAYGIESEIGHTKTALKFDNSPVTITEIAFGNANGATESRELAVTVQGNPTDLAELIMSYRLVGESDWKQLKIYNSESHSAGEISAFAYDDTQNTSTGTVTVTGDLLGLTASESKRFYFRFTTYDTAGNQAVYALKDSYLFDTFDRCSVNMNIDSNAKVYEVSDVIEVDGKTTVNGSENSYRNSYYAEDFSVTFNLTDSTSDLNLFTLFRGNEDVTANATAYFEMTKTTTSGTAGDRVNLQMKYIVEEGGYFTVQLEGDSKKSQTFTFYLAGKADNVAGYKATTTDKLLVNKIYVVEDVKYYWMSDNNTVVTGENYNGTKKSLVFSSRDRAFDYYYFMEEQDLTVLYIDKASIAEALNNRYTETLRKASGETVTAEVGQTWIGYKSSSWDQSSESRSWNYYYYSSVKTDEINVNALSSNLRSAINTVTNKIVDKGSYVYLTSESGLDSHGIPTIDGDRILPNTITVNQTKSGKSYTSALQFAGDGEIYAPNYTYVDGSEYPIATQCLTASDYTLISYKKHDGTHYEALDVIAGSYYLKDVITGTGIYDIVERDAEGIRSYSVYIDNSSPSLTVTYDNSNDGTSQTMEIDSEYAKRGITLNVKSFAFESLKDDDSFAYVAIFTSGGTYKGAYFGSELSQATLNEGRYILQIYDRSGNGYSLPIRISTADLSTSCSYVNEKNRYVRFTCTYSADDIYRFEIYLDNVLQTDSVSSLKNSKITYYEGGTYRFYVEDLFGNVYDEETTLVREVPQVTWQYLKNGEYATYTESDTIQIGMTETKLGSSSYLITSQGKVRFYYPLGEDYEFEFLSGTYTKSSSRTNNYVEINETDNWQVKIYYSDFPDVYVTYTGKSDTSAPTISATTNRPLYRYGDSDEDFADYLKSFLKAENIGKRINPPSVAYSQYGVTTETVRSGEIVSGSLVCIGVDDISGIYKWSYTHNGEITEYEKGSEGYVSKIYLSREGDYTVTATDMLGNTSTFAFSIGNSDNTTIKIGDHSLSDSALGGDRTVYENEKATATLTGAGSFVFLVDGEYYKLTTDGSNLVSVSYTVAKDETTGEIIALETDTVLAEQLTEKPVVINSYVWGTISAYRKDGSVTVEIALAERSETDVKKVSLSLRVQSDESTDVKYAVIALSDEISYANYTYGDKTDTLSETLYVNSGFTLIAPDAGNTYRIYHSETDNFDNADIRYFDAGCSYTCDKMGFYLVEVCNRYGNLSQVKVFYRNGITVVRRVEYADGEGKTYSPSYTGDLYSNESISLTVYDEVTVTLTKDGVTATPTKLETADGVTTVTVYGDGEYAITVTDIYGNSVTIPAHIVRKTYDCRDIGMGGFNEKALRFDEGYTNQKVFFEIHDVIAVDASVTQKVASITVEKDGEKVLIYDSVSETPTALNTDYRIGDDGDGTYTVTFRDIYGNSLIKEVHYQSQSPLTVSRVTRSSAETVYTLDRETLEKGIWSNKTVTFFTTASEYRFTINGESKDIPLSLTFPTESDTGKIEYTVTYLDEYGFEYTFKCTLMRAEVEIHTDGMTVRDDVTKDPVSVTFDSSYTAEIFIGGVSYGAYTSGTKYLTDGLYTFTVTDLAGNVRNYTVKRDSIVEYVFYTETKDEKLVNGEVSNANRINFAPLNGDSVSYLAVYHNGVEIEDYESSTFSESGEWKILLTDEMGNKDYFCFYLVNHALISFDYNTPEGFTVTDMTYDAGTGVKYDSLDLVDVYDTYSHIAFEETGEYRVVLTSDITGHSFGFTVTIDKTVPEILLTGVTAGETTKQNVTISGVHSGDTVYIYRDGELVKEVKVTSSADVPQITEKGKYKIVVVNEAGGSSSVEFTRTYTANVATSVLIIIVIVAIVIGLFAGLLFRKKSRIE